jgi:predicted GIY-YIG superfamily endonuclease
MPKTKMDYSNTIIYKIFCKDPSIKEIYIGHTTNFVTRKSEHKTSCKNSNIYIYIYIVI